MEDETVSVRCDNTKAVCGFRGAPAYVHAPATSFQMYVRAREDQVRELQQYTRTFNAKVVERCVLGLAARKEGSLMEGDRA